MNDPDALSRFWCRLLSFRASATDYLSFDRRHLTVGLLACWIVGVGRYWDDNRASLLQHTGLGSVAYVFVLATVLWITVKPMAPEYFAYREILTFITLTAPPALLYAIPVEKWMSLQAANLMNVRFLAIVAVWRWLLWIHYLWKCPTFTGWRIFIAATMPLAVILVALVNLNHHHVVFNIMGGIRDADKGSQDEAYSILWLLSILSMPVSLISFLGWVAVITQRYRFGPDSSDRAMMGKN